MSGGSEYTQVERPLLEQLAGLGWQIIEGDKFDPTVSGRVSFREYYIEARFREALRRINTGPAGDEWLDDLRLTEAFEALTRAGQGKLVEMNERVTARLVEGVYVQGLPDWDQGRTQHIQFIDFKEPGNNDFLAISQFRVDEPGGQARQYIVPDVVLFVNGIPLVVVECKSPTTVDPMAEGIKQLRRYSNQRSLGAAEGNERLFWTNQFVISTFGHKARLGSFTSAPEHYLEWKDPFPMESAELASLLGRENRSALTGQETLVAGTLTPQNLLDLVRHFVVFTFAGGKRVKVVARYQQYRAVRKAVRRLTTGETRHADGEVDRRGGLIWHTQGSGKSLTMIFLVRTMRSDPALRPTKVVVVTDRTDLEKQLAATAQISGETIQRVRRADKLRKILAEHGPGLVFAMIQKYRDTDNADQVGLAGDEICEELGVLNTDASIVILVDEAHRSQTSALHANLMAALPNAAKIGFTGTPIMAEGKKKTTSIFGTFIDTYTLRQAEEDGAVVPIFYEGRTAKGAVSGGSDLDQLFEDMFVEQSPREIEELKNRYATTGAVLEAPALIAAKARSMMWHYLSAIFPGGFKAQVAATSRVAAVRYREALIAARDEFVKLAGDLPSSLIEEFDTGSLDVDSLPRETQILLRSRAQLDLIRELEFVPIISGDNNDDPTWATWTDKAKQERAIEDFKKPLGKSSEKSSPVAFLVVRTMLLTGFDAPIEQVLYLDRFIQDAELLQAVARVNRTARGKTAGFLVDYYGIGSDLKKALKAYAPEDALDVTGALASIKDELPKLADRHSRVLAIFSEVDFDSADPDEAIEACVQVLENEPLRVRFDVQLKSFLMSLDTVLPRPEGLVYVKDAKRLGVVQKLARRRYRDDAEGDFDASLYGEKVRTLIDEHVLALDIATKIPPVSITSQDFVVKVNGLTSDKAKSLEMEHALRFHIRKNFDQDPARYSKLSNRLEEILKTLGDKWEQLTLELVQLLDEIRAEEDTTAASHIDPLVSRFYGLIEQELFGTGGPSDEVRGSLLVVAQSIVEVVSERTLIVRFWQNHVAQDDLRREIRTILDDSDLFPFDEQESVADTLLELASANRNRFAERRDRETA